jgi:hypothetical protein
MPNWKKVITSGSIAALSSLYVNTSITGSTISASSGITGSLFGTASWALSASWAPGSSGPGGTNTQLQYNKSGSLAGVIGLTWETGSSNFLVNSGYYVMDFPLSSGGAFLGRGGNNLLMQMGFNAQAQYGGTIGTISGNQFFVYNFQEALGGANQYYWGFNNTGDNYWGSSNTLYSVKVQQPRAASIPLSILGRSDQTANLFQISKDADTEGGIVTIDATGSVGIGTAAPASKLHVDGTVTVNGELDVSGSAIISGSLTVTSDITGSLQGTASWATNFVSASNYVLNSATSSFVLNSQTSSFVQNNQTSSFATTGSNTFNGTQTITGSGQLLMRSNTSTAVVITTTDFNAGTSTGTTVGIGVATVTGNTYASLTTRTSGGIGNGNLALLSAGGNVAIGKTTFNAVLDVNGNTVVTGSLNVTAGITGSLQGTASFASNGGVTQITAGSGISINQATGNVTITSTGGGGGISQGKVVAITTGYSNLF